MPTSSDKRYEYDCFISYSKSSAEARLLYVVLRAWGLTVWWDKHHLKGTSTILKETTEAARRSDRFIAVYSRKWGCSSACREELKAYSESHEESTILPVVFYSEKIPQRFKRQKIYVYRLDRHDEWGRLAEAFQVGAGPLTVVEPILKDLQEVLAWNKLQAVLDAPELVASLQEAPPSIQAAIGLLNRRRLRDPLRELVRAVLSGDYSWAATLAEERQALLREYASFWFYWGVALHELGKHDEAREKMLEASRLGLHLPKKWKELYLPNN